MAESTLMAAPRGASGARLAMQIVMAAAAIWWLLFWCFQPVTTTKAWLNTIDTDVNSKFQGTRGSLFLLQLLPIIVIAFLSFFVLELQRRLTKPSAKVLAEGRKPRINIWSLPIFVRSPFFGMLTVGDLFCILVVLFVVLWYSIKYAVFYVHRIDSMPMKHAHYSKLIQKLYAIGVLFGNTSVIPIALLWIPVARGSAIQQVVGLPFERGVKYHTWLGFLAIWLVILHGGLLTGYYASIHETNDLITWYAHGQGISVLAGVVAAATGIIMMLTAMERVRRKLFDLFFTAHHLYLVFLIFYAFHCVNRVMYIIIPLLIFFTDRFIRLLQSRKPVDVLSAKVYKSGIIELKFAKAANSTYGALSFLFVKLPSVSRLQWHPFSVASSPLDGTNEISIFIKPLGGFTKTLHDVLISTKSNNPGRDLYKCPFSSKMQVEGPYGDESAFYLRYKNLVMVAGGIGVTPFLAIIRDILHRYKLRQEDLPSSVQLIFCVRKVTELHILDAIAHSSILPEYPELGLTITIDAYITIKSATAQESNSTTSSSYRDLAAEVEIDYADIHDPNVSMSLTSSGRLPEEMSPISSGGHVTWVAATFTSTIVGFFVINGMVNVTILEINSVSSYKRAFIYATAIIIAVVVFGGGMMVLLWTFFREKAHKHQSRVTSQLSRTQSPLQDRKDIETSLPTNQLWQQNVTYGTRPDWKDSFQKFAREHEGQDVGVLVSGGNKMREEIAFECRHHTLSRASTVVMHYHSVSFEL